MMVPALPRCATGPEDTAAWMVQQPALQTMHSPLFAAVNDKTVYGRCDLGPDRTFVALQPDSFAGQPHHTVPAKDRCGW
jgi:hypothetical protein